MYALVFWIESRTISIVDTSSFPPSANENDEIDLLDDKENTMHKAKIIKISENNRWLQTIDVDVEGHLMVQQMHTRSKNKRPMSKKQKKKTNVPRNLDPGLLEKDLFEPGDSTPVVKSGKPGKSTEALSTSLRCSVKRTKVVIDTSVSPGCSIPKGSECFVPAVSESSFPEAAEKYSNSIVELETSGRTPKDVVKKISTPSSNATTPVIQPSTPGLSTEKPGKGKKKRTVDIDSQPPSDPEIDDSSQVQKNTSSIPRVELETSGRTPKDVVKKISTPSSNATTPVIQPSTPGLSTEKPGKGKKKRTVDIDSQPPSDPEIDDSSQVQKNTSSIPRVELETAGRTPKDVLKKISTPSSNVTTPVIQSPTPGQSTEKPGKGKKKRKIDIDSQPPSDPEIDDSSQVQKNTSSIPRVELETAGRTPKDVLKKISTPSSNVTTPVIQSPTPGQSTEKPGKGKKKRKIDIDSQPPSDTEIDDSSQVQKNTSSIPQGELESAGRIPKKVLKKISTRSSNSTAPVIKPSTSGQSTHKPAKMIKKDALKGKNNRTVDIDSQSPSDTEIDDSSQVQKNTSTIPGVTLENLAQCLRPMFVEILEKMDQQKPSTSSIRPRITRSSSSSSSDSDSPTPGTSEPPKMRKSRSGHTEVELQPGSGVFVDCIELTTNIDRFNKSPKEMVRRLLVYLVGAENLKTMTARGISTKPGKNGNPKKCGRAAVPKKILDAIKYYVDRKGSPMDWPYFIRVVNLKCDTLRNPKQAPGNTGKATKDRDDEDNV